MKGTGTETDYDVCEEGVEEHWGESAIEGIILVVERSVVVD